MNSTRYNLIFLSLAAIFLTAFVAHDLYQLRLDNEETSRLLNLSDEHEKDEVQSRLLRMQRESAQADIAAFESFVLTEETLVPVIENIESAGRALGLETEIVSVTNEIGQSEGSPQKIEIVIDSLGAWKGSFAFIRAIENLPYRVNIKESSLSRSEAEWRGRVALTLDIFQ